MWGQLLCTLMRWYLNNNFCTEYRHSYSPSVTVLYLFFTTTQWCFVDMCHLLVFCWHVLSFGVLLTCAIFWCFVDMCYLLVFCWHVPSFGAHCMTLYTHSLLHSTFFRTSSIFRHALFQIVHKLLLQHFDDAVITFIRQENLLEQCMFEYQAGVITNHYYHGPQVIQ